MFFLLKDELPIHFKFSSNLFFFQVTYQGPCQLEWIDSPKYGLAGNDIWAKWVTGRILSLYKDMTWMKNP